MRFPFSAVCAAALCATLPARSDEAHQKQFDALVRPALEGFCNKCHGPEKHKGGLNFAEHAL